MNKLLQKLAKLTLGLAMAAGVGVAVSTKSKNTEQAKADYESLFSIDAGDIVSGSSYQAHTATVSERGWLITFGGNNSSVGTNSSKRGNCKLSSYSKYAVSPVTTSSVASAFANTTKISNVSKIEYTFSGGSNQSSTNVYLLYSSDNTTFSQMTLTSGTQGAAISSGTAYEFAECSGYFAVLFVATNSSGNWRIDSVSLEFFSVAKSLSSISVADNSGKTWHVGDTIAASDLTVTPTYSDGEGSPITDGTGVYFNSSHTQTVSSALTLGTNSIIVYYTDAYGSADNSTSPLSVSAEAALVLDTIAVETAPTKTDYIENENFDPTGLVIRRNYEGGTHDTYTYANHTSEFTFNPSTSTALTTSDTSVTITYGGKTTTQAITVDVQHGTESNPYTVAEALAAPVAQGVYVTGIISTITEVSTTYGNATYRISDDGTTTGEMIVYRGKYVNNTSFTSADQIKLGDHVVVTGNLTVYSNANQLAQNNYIVTLTRKELSSITLSGYTDSYYVGDTFSFDGTVTAHYTDSSTETVTATSVSSPDMSSSGNKSVTVTYEEGGISKTANYSITVNTRTLSSISVNTPPTKTTYAAGEYFDPSGLVINTIWEVGSDGTVSYNEHSGDFTFSPELNVELTKSTKSVTIYYGGKSTTQAITVNVVARYELVSSTEGLVAGCKYLISDYDQTVFMSTTQNTNNRGQHSLVGEVSDDIVVFESGMEVLTLGGSTGAWTLYANNSETKGYLYLPGNNNYLKTRETSFTWSITVSSGTATIGATVSDNTRFIQQNSGSSIFSCYKSGQNNISLWKEISTAESVSISKANVSGLKTDSDTTVSITANNFTPDDIEVSYSEANVATVDKGTINNGIIPLIISFNGVGTTVATITVTGGESNHDVDLTISVAAKPDSLVVSGNGIVLVDGGQTVANRRLEIQTGAIKQFSATHFTMLDTDENNMSATASDVTLSRTSGDDVVTFDGAKITAGSTPGSCVVRFASKLVSSVYYEITVNVVADYNVSVNSITYNDDLVDDQGHTLDISAIFKTKVANTHFGSTAPILDSELKFSYEDNDYANAVPADSFVYDFEHGTTSVAFGEGYKDQTVFVYTTFTESRVSSFEITIAQADNPLISISLDTGNSYNLQRNTTHQLVVSYNPSDTTDNRDVVYSLSNSSTGSTITVSSTGLIAAGSKVGSVATITATVDPDADPNTENSVSASVVVTVTRETLTITAEIPETWDLVSNPSTLAAGDQVLITGVKNEETLAMGTYSSGNNVKAVVESPLTINDDNQVTSGITDAMIYTLIDCGTAGMVAFEDSTGKYLYAASATANHLKSQDEIDNNAKFAIDGSSNVVASNSSNRNRMRFNPNGNNDAMFACYANDTTGTVVTFYKKSGGTSEVTVSDALFNVVDAAMSLKDGSSTLYDLGLCNASGTSFNVSAWNALGNNFTSAIISDNKLAYARADENGNEIEQFLAVYDYIIGKKESGYAAYASANDFLGRVDSGKITASPRVNPLVNIIGENTNTIAIIVIISMVSVGAIGGYFFIRRKQEN